MVVRWRGWAGGGINPDTRRSAFLSSLLAGTEKDTAGYHSNMNSLDGS